MRILVAGDFCPQYRTAELLEQGRFEELLGDVKPDIEQADYSIVNFECPIVNGKGNPIPKCGPNLRTTAKAVDLIKYAGFKAVTLANNHFLDYGEEGVRDTLETLDNAGIAHVGGGINLSEASKTMYIEGDAGKIAIINCCEHEFSIATETSAGSNPLNPVQQWYAIQEARRQADYVIVIVHGGHEHYQLPSPRMKETYRFFIDCGADAVVNHHQHCYSGYEIYRGKPIFYGLGNFFFDEEGTPDPKWHEGYIASIEIIEGVTRIDTIPYVQCGKNPSVNLLNNSAVVAFNANITSINRIIENDTLLKRKFDNMACGNFSSYRTLFSPFSNRYLRAICARGWLPSFMPKKKGVQIFNYMVCEAHRDKLLNYFKKFI